MRKLIVGCAAFVCLAGCSDGGDSGEMPPEVVTEAETLPVSNTDDILEDALPSAPPTEGVGVNEIGE